ncbi:cytochrome c-type biogenesis protein [Qingshengfaniella alkalisoli]|uniref:Cytochrome c-type biogenesis protein n=1 Tax=Qingshengfaniella alkalisoli TaxID=2599296 RepID=A0A5B8J4J8_9RHOB|nr:cytochrome c-type biogenesis protein [Qingshengfaniella alkalisoli]QDY69200.1 cytochrome c-type biogenesis protein CcmH [Qingshengfaniella alkalisoli]
MMRLRTALAVLFCVLAAPAYAVQPDEVLSDPALEDRARDISQELRCLVCRNENIDESNAGLARDLRLLVRERLVEGDTNDEVVDFVVDRYGEYVLLRPQTDGANLILWLAGPVLLICALALAVSYQRRHRSARTDESPLDADEAKRLEEILKD